MLLDDKPPPDRSTESPDGAGRGGARRGAAGRRVERRGALRRDPDPEVRAFDRRYRLARAGIVVIVTCAVAGGGWAYAQARIDLWNTRIQLADAEKELAQLTKTLLSTANTLAQTKAALVQRTSERDALEASLNQAKLYLIINGNTLNQTKQQVQTETQYVTTLSTCLTGVEKALNAISVNDNASAVAALSSVSSACTQAQQDTGVASSAHGGPVYSFDFADPFVLNDGGTYIGYATNSAEGNIQMISSTDLAHWKPLGDALATLPAWATRGDTWAPGVLPIAGGYVMYYATAVHLDGQDCISAATSPTPTGPFTDNSTSPMICQTDLGGSIDPYPFYDAGGAPWIVWKSEGNGTASSALWTQRLGADGVSLTGPATQILTPSLSWEGGIVEGPAMLVSGGAYYLFYSANDWTTSSYAIGIAGCSSPAGPCSKDPDPFLASGSLYEGPGGPTVFPGPGGSLYLGFHAWLPGEVGYPNFRYLFLRQIDVSSGSVTLA